MEGLIVGSTGLPRPTVSIREEQAAGELGMKTSATSMATRLAAAVILVSLVSLVVATWVGLTTGRDLGEDLFVDRLGSLQTSAAFDTTATMVSLDRAATAAAESPQAAAAGGGPERG